MKDINNPPSICLGLPNTGNIRIELMLWIMQSRIQHFCPVTAKPHDACRNLIVKNFLQSDCDFLLMIDSDVVPITPVHEMWKNNVPVCSAYVRTFKGDIGELIPVGMMKSETHGYHHNYEHSNPEGAPHKVDAVGTGCIMIRRDVLENMEPPYFKFIYDADGLLVNGEDFDFCDRVDDV